jgi:hypothetical protein
MKNENRYKFQTDPLRSINDTYKLFCNYDVKTLLIYMQNMELMIFPWRLFFEIPKLKMLIYFVVLVLNVSLKKKNHDWRSMPVKTNKLKY